MIDPRTARLWGYRALFLFICAVMTLFYLLPLQITSPGWIAPDLLLVLTFAWVLRRPSYVPVISVILVFLLADFFFQRPPGLYAALALMGAEFLRGRAPFMDEVPFLMEWLIVAVVICTVMLANRLILIFAVVEASALGLAAAHVASTVLAYPVIVAVSRFVLGVRRPMPNEGSVGRVLR